MWMRRWGGPLLLLTLGTGWRAFHLDYNYYHAEGQFMGTSTDLDATTPECWKNIYYSCFCGRTGQSLESWLSLTEGLSFPVSELCCSFHSFSFCSNPFLHGIAALQVKPGQAFPQKGWLECSFWKNTFECLLPEEGPKKGEPQVQSLL